MATNSDGSSSGSSSGSLSSEPSKHQILPSDTSPSINMKILPKFPMRKVESSLTAGVAELNKMTRVASKRSQLSLVPCKLDTDGEHSRGSTLKKR